MDNVHKNPRLLSHGQISTCLQTEAACISGFFSTKIKKTKCTPKIIGTWKPGSLDEVGIPTAEVNQNRTVWMEEQFSTDGSWRGSRKLFPGGGGVFKHNYFQGSGGLEPFPRPSRIAQEIFVNG